MVVESPPPRVGVVGVEVHEHAEGRHPISPIAVENLEAGSVYILAGGRDRCKHDVAVSHVEFERKDGITVGF